MNKKVIIFIVILLLLGGGYWFWNKKVQENKISDIFQYIPNDFIYLLETNKPINSWNEIADSKTWNHLKGNTTFKELTDAIEGVDSLIKDNPTIFSKIDGRKVLVASYMISSSDYDFLYAIDIEDAQMITIINEFVSNISMKGYVISKTNYQNQPLIKVFSKADKSNLYLCFKGNYILVSYNYQILQKALDAPNKQNNIALNTKYEFAKQLIDGDGLINVYFNYAYFDNYLNTFLSEPNAYLSYMSKALEVSAYDLKLKDEFLLLNGKTSLNDSVFSYFKAFINSGSSDATIPDYAPQRTSFMMHLGFKSFPFFFEQLETEMKKDIAEYEEYMKNMAMVEKFLGINIKEDFISWIGSELAVMELQSAGEGSDNEYALLLKAANIEVAKEHLAKVKKKVKNRTPVKFKEVTYKGYGINYLGVKGVFKVVLGKFFDKYDKPYYTIINDMVIFAGHPQVLESIIDDYEANFTLAKKQSYRDFMKKFEDESSVFVYVNTPILFNTLKNMGDYQTRVDMEKNNQYIKCFKHIGFQLTSNGVEFETILGEQFDTTEEQIEHAEKTAEEDSIARIDLFELPYIYPKNPNESVYKQYYADSTTLYYEVELKNGFKDGSFRMYHTNGEVKLKGKYNMDQRVGTWKAYDEQGTLLDKKDFDE